MADIKRTTEGLEHCLARYVDGLCDDCPYMGEIDRSYMVPMKCKEIIMRDAHELLKSQQAEIDRLNDTLRIMYNRCICFCGSQNCSECKQKEECESKRSFWHGYYLLHGKRVKKEGE